MSLAIAALLAAAAQVAAPGQTTATDLPHLFAAACLDGQARLPAGEATKADFAQLPPELKRNLGAPASSNVWRLASGGEAYLYVLDYPDAPHISRQICGVASDQLDLHSGADMLDARLAGGGMGQRARTMQWMMPKDGYAVTATTLSSFGVLQVNWLSSADVKLAQEETAALPR